MGKFNFFFLFFLFIGLHFSSAQIFTWKNPNPTEDSLKKDSIISAKITKEIFRKDTADFVRSPTKTIIDEGVLVKNSRSKILGDLNTNGSIIRGITFGNNQGASVKSSMDLQISGRLSEEVSILASISDHNLSIQSDGYTQTLDEFDKIYIQLNIKNNSILRAGHIDLTDESSYFARYQRKSMGLQYHTLLGKEKKTSLDINAGVARSEFNRIRFQGEEGNQGPYRMTGKNGETYITILSGSEQVYIDGVLMKRGENQDYTINYNTGELTFTSFRPIYEQNYITVSYNYTNRNYSRFQITGNIQHQKEKMKYGINWFIETDNKNAPVSLELSDEDKQVLAAAGNDTDLMYSPSGTETEYDADKILYKKVYTTDGYYYEYSTDASETLYEVSFTYMGEDSGDYDLQQTTTNGKVYEYVGENLGYYSAVRQLAAPSKTQVISGNFEYALENGKIGADFSLSNYDPNLFSKIGNKQNTGFAGRVYASKNFKKRNWIGNSTLEYQHISSNFHILDQINDTEFARDFNLDEEFSGITQNRLIFSFGNQWGKNASVNYRINYLNEKDNYTGIKNDIDFSFRKGKITTTGKLSYLNTKATELNTNFTRGNVAAQLNGKKGFWAVGGSMEHNLKKYNETGLYYTSSYSWKEVFLQKKIGDSARTRLLSKVYYRDNDSIRNNQLANMNHIVGIMAESQLIKSQRTQLSTLVHYRKFFYQYEDDSQSENKDFIVGNIIYNQQLFRNGMRLQAFYELGNGQEAQRTFQYVKVTDGLGTYKWTDYNGDGIQTLDEFEIAEYSDEAKYTKVYTSTTSYVPSNRNKLQLALFLNPYVIFNSGNPFLKRWNFNISLLSQNSFLKNDNMVVLNPFKKEDDQILKNQNLLFSAMFNSTSTSGWNGNYRFVGNNNLSNSNYSVEESKKNTHTFNIGYFFSSDFRIDWENTLASVYNHSQVYTTRNYELDNLGTKPKVTYKFSTTLQTEFSAAYTTKTRTDGEEKLKTTDLTGTVQWEKDKTSLRASFSFINNNFTGSSYSVVGNQMLDGLKAGKNQVWSLYLQQNINSFLILNLNYDGRNSGEKTIHTGSVQLKASF